MHTLLVDIFIHGIHLAVDISKPFEQFPIATTTNYYVVQLQNWSHVLYTGFVCVSSTPSFIRPISVFYCRGQCHVCYQCNNNPIQFSFIFTCTFAVHNHEVQSKILTQLSSISQSFEVHEALTQLLVGCLSKWSTTVTLNERQLQFCFVSVRLTSTILRDGTFLN